MGGNISGTKTWIVAALAAAVCTQACAGDASRTPGPATAASAWTGWYAGASLGYGFGTGSVAIAPITHAGRDGFVSPLLNDRPEGGLAGLTLGVNRQTQNFVYGLETDLSYAAINDRVAGPFLIPPFNFQTTDSQRLEALGTLRARAGFVLPNGALLYATGGLAYGHATMSTFAIDTSANLCNSPVKFCTYGTAAQWKAGWTAGAGWELPLARAWSARIEYLYYDLGAITDFMTDGLTPPGNFQGSAAIRGSVLRLGVNYALGKS